MRYYSLYAITLLACSILLVGQGETVEAAKNTSEQSSSVQKTTRALAWSSLMGALAASPCFIQAYELAKIGELLLEPDEQSTLEFLKVFTGSNKFKFGMRRFVMVSASTLMAQGVWNMYANFSEKSKDAVE